MRVGRGLVTHFGKFVRDIITVPATLVRISPADACRVAAKTINMQRRIGRGSRAFFGLPVAANAWCQIDTSSFDRGVALDLSQAALASPLLDTSAQVQLFCDGVLMCTLSNKMPNARLPTRNIKSVSFECVGPAGSGIHVTGNTYQINTGREVAPQEGGRTLAEWEATQVGRKRRIDELRREAATAAQSPTTTPKRIPRLTFNPSVLVAEYVPKRSGISPVRAYASLDEMVRAREEIKARQEMEAMSGADDDDGETLQQVLAELQACSIAKLRKLCKANGLDQQGNKLALMERLIEHIGTCLREERA